MRKIPFVGIELTSQRVRGLRGTSELPGRPCTVCLKKNQDAPRPSEHPLVSHIQPEKTTSHGGQSRSLSAEQGKEDKIKSPAAYPPTPHTARSEKLKSYFKTFTASPVQQLMFGCNLEEDGQLDESGEK